MRTLVLFSAVSLAACSGTSNEQPLSSDQALQAMNESSSSAEATEYASASMDIASKLTVGAALDDALRAVSTFVTGNLPCANVAIAGNTITIDYGANAGSCTYDGYSFAGSQVITVTGWSATDIEIDQSWSKLSGSGLEIAGSAHVSWDVPSSTRHVVADLTWTRLRDMMTGQLHIDLAQTPLDGDFTTGLTESGQLSWVDPSGNWAVAISDAEQRWTESVPQAGLYVLVMSDSREVAIKFTRVDAATIAAVVTNGASSFTFDVRADGESTLY